MKFIFGAALAFVAMMPLQAQSEGALSLKDGAIRVEFLDPLLSFDAANSILYALVKEPGKPLRVVQLLYTVKDKHILSDFRCYDGKDWVPVPITGKADSCLPLLAKDELVRPLRMEIVSAERGTLAGRPTLTAAGRIGEAISLAHVKPVAGSDVLWIRARPVHRAAAVASHLESCTTMTLKVTPNKDEAFLQEYELAAKFLRTNRGDELDGEAPDTVIGLLLEKPLPKRPLDYKIKLTVPKNCFGRTDIALIPVADEAVVAATEVKAPESVTEPAGPFYPPSSSGQAILKADLTFTSYVNPLDSSKVESRANNGKRRNVGLIDLTLKRQKELYAEKGRALLAGVSYRGNVSTLPLGEAKVPTQTEHLAGFEYQQDFGSRNGLRQLIVGGAGVWETDRDYKFQVSHGRVSITPVFGALYQPKAVRTNRIGNNSKRRWLTSFHLLPTLSYERGDVVRDRKERLIQNINFQDRITRLHGTVNLNLGIYRGVEFNIRDDAYQMWNVDRRSRRNYLDASISLDPRPFFGNSALGGLESSFVIKFQRGETAPEFLPVNVFSLGISLTK